MIVIVEKNKDGKIVVTEEQLKQWLEEARAEGYREAQKPAAEPLTAGPLTTNPYPENPYINTPWKAPTAITYTNPGPACETCPSRPDPNKIVIGDTPCTWCEKNRVTCTSGSNIATKPSSNEWFNSVVKDLVKDSIQDTPSNS